MSPNEHPVMCRTFGWRGKRAVLRLGQGCSVDMDDQKYGMCPNGHYAVLRSSVLEDRRIRKAKADLQDWSGSCDPKDPSNFWIDDKTGERVNAWTGERTRANDPN